MSTYDEFADEYSAAMGELGDDVHQTQIDPFIYKTVGNIERKVICDLGFGNGYMARHFAGKGAKVYASDISNKLISIAKSKTENKNVNYSVHNADNLTIYKDRMFDCVVMNMSIHYLNDLNKLFSEVSRVLRKDGVFTFSTNHFFRPNYPYSEWVTGNVEGEERLFIKVTDYLEKRSNKIISWWNKKSTMMIYNHTLQEFINGMSEHGLLTFKIFEPEPINSGQVFSLKLQRSHHIPTFIIIGARKI